MRMTVLLLLLILLLAGCSNPANISENTATDSTGVTTSERKNTTDNAEDSVSVSDRVFETASSDAAEQNTAEILGTPTEETQHSKVPNIPSAEPPVITPPAQSTAPVVSDAPSQEPEPEPTAPSESSQPTEPDPMPSKAPPSKPVCSLIEGQLYYKPEDDPYGIVVQIREYAEGKGFIFTESLNMENSSWRGRPNHAYLGTDEVLDSLRYHIDKICDLYGPTEYNVAFRIYQGMLEYMFLYN